VPANDNAFDQQAALISAAHAAASWARARRTQWTTVPLAVAVTSQAAGDVAETLFDPGPASQPMTVETIPAQRAAPVAFRRRPDIRAAVSAARRTVALGAPLLPWLARGAIAAALVAAAVAGGRYVWSVMPALPSLPARTASVDPKPAGVGAAGKAAGALHVTSTPDGAKVLVDGKPRGVTPLTVADLRPGRHEVALQSDAGTVHRTVTVDANQTATIDEAIFSGFVTVFAPFDVTITESGRVLRADDRHQIMVPPGVHNLRFTNRALAYETARQVDVKPGETTNLQLTPEPSALTVTATDASEVWVDGARLGDTPLNAAPVPLGAHEIVVKRAAGGERRFAVTIGAKPFTLNVEF
jgi:hypothetical protein